MNVGGMGYKPGHGQCVLTTCSVFAEGPTYWPALGRPEDAALGGAPGAPAPLTTRCPDVIGPLPFPLATAWLPLGQPNHRSCLIKPSTAPAAGRVATHPLPEWPYGAPTHARTSLSLPQALGYSPLPLISSPLHLGPQCFTFQKTPDTPSLSRFHSQGGGALWLLSTTPLPHFTSPTPCPAFP